MKTRKIILLLTLFIPFLIISSCEKDDEEDNTDNNNKIVKPLAILDIANAKNLMIVPPNQKKSTNDSLDNVNKLFKVTDDGYVMEVEYYDEDTNLITTTKYPQSIHSVDNNFIFITFIDSTNLPETYLVRIEDGAVFSYGATPDQNLPPEAGGAFLNSKFIHTDNYNNIYLLSTWIRKIDVSNPDNLTEEQITSDVEEVHCFIVDGNGNIIYSGNNIGFKLRFLNGGLHFLESATKKYWLGYDNNFYYYTNSLVKININNNTAEEIQLSDTLPLDFAGQYIIKMENLNKIIIISQNQLGSIVIAEVYNNENKIKSQDMNEAGLQSVEGVIYSQNYYYIEGKNNSTQPILLKFDASSFPHTFELLLEENMYDIYKMTVSSEDEVVFNALRMSDGKKVIGRISSGGTVEIIDEELDRKLIQLIQIQ